ncbi:MAG TPA: IPT/TIG domain-containing protein, partial [Gemmataceae bacterium]|nr:IPT/TIG domain-containing protein [Gemmataceae bacterium]
MFTSWSRRYGRSPGLTSKPRRAQGIRNRILDVELLEDRTVPAPLTNGAFTQAVDFTQPPNGQNWQASDANFVSVSASPSGGQAYIQDNGQFFVTTSLYQDFQLPSNLPNNASLSFTLNVVTTDDLYFQPPGFGAALLDSASGLSLVPTVSSSDSFYTRDLFDGNTGLIASGVTETWVNPAQAPAVVTIGVPGQDTPTPATAQGQQFNVTVAIPSVLAGKDAEILFQVISNGNGRASASIAQVAVNTSATPVLTSLSPTSATEGNAPFTLTVNGSNFDSSSTVDWNGTGLTTTFVSGAELQAVVPASDIAEEGSANITVVSASGESNALSFAIGPDPAVSATGINFSPGEAQFGTNDVATFTDPGGAEANDGSHYSATIDWGDNSSSSGFISFSGTLGSKADAFTVTGSHNYSEEGSYQVTTTINHEGIITTTTSMATVADANLAGSSAATAGGTEGAADSSVLSGATFRDANSGAPAGDFKAV